MNRFVFCLGILSVAGIFLVRLAPRATAAQVDVSADFLASFNDIQANNVPNTDTDGLKYEQVGVNFTGYFGDFTTTYVRVVGTGSSVSLDEAWVKISGLPANGSFTFGRFYKPLGAPIPLANLSFPALLVHAFPDVGVKFNFESYPFVTEFGYVNGNPLAIPTLASRVAGTPILSQMHISDRNLNHLRDVYLRGGVEFGEPWGSLTAGLTYTRGKLSPTELRLLNPINPFTPSLLLKYRTEDRRNKREHFSFDVDYEKGPYEVFGEFLRARDGRVLREVYSVSAQRTFFHRFGQVTFGLAYDKFNINTGALLLQRPETWDRERRSATITYAPSEYLQFIAEYDWNLESARDAAGKEIDNNEFVLQGLLYF